MQGIMIPNRDIELNMRTRRTDLRKVTIPARLPTASKEASMKIVGDDPQSGCGDQSKPVDTAICNG